MPEKETTAAKSIPIGLRMKPRHVAMLDRLCAVNRRSRREIIEALLEDAIEELNDDPTFRL